MMVFVGTIAFVWLFAELGRALLEVVDRSGFSSIPFDGVVQHKAGEIMVGAPLFLVALFGYVRSKENLFAFANRMQIVMIVGGLLNGIAWYSLRTRESLDSFFRTWCLILLVVGLFGSQIAGWLIAKSKQKTNGTG